MVADPRNDIDRWKPSRYSFWATLEPGCHLLFNGVSGALFQLDEGERRAAEELLRLAMPPPGDPLHDRLISGGFLVPAVLDEVGRLLNATPGDGTLALTLVPTLECNFRCEYCYVDFQLGRMAADITGRILRFTENAIEDRTCLEVNWFGGEPLLDLPLVVELTPKLGAIADRASIPWRGMIATNGWLLSPNAALSLRKAGIRYFHVTVDGPARHHDRLRPLRSGRATFGRIVSNIRSLLDEVPDAQLTLRLNADESNVDDLAEVLGEIPFPARRRIQVNATEIRRCDLLPAQPLRRRLNRVLRTALEMGYRYYDNFVPVGRRLFCHADSPHHFQIAPDGAVSRCSASPSKPEVTVGFLGPEGALRLDDRERRFRAVPQILPDCRECPYLCFCLGGCRLHRLRGRLDPACRSRFEDDMEGLIINRYLAARPPVFGADA